MTEVLRTWLEMTDRAMLRAAPAPEAGLRLEEAHACTASFYRYLYATVGAAYHWIDRLPWTDERIRVHLADPTTRILVMYARGTPAGYFELHAQDDGAVNIAYFGLLPEFLGRGLGRYLLSAAVTEAWDIGATRVLVNTCSLDDAAALPNYLSRGFVVYRTDTYVLEEG